MHRLTQGVAVAIMGGTLAIASPALAKSHVPMWAHGFETVSAVTPSSVSVKHADGLEQKLPMAHLKVRAGLYPASTAILRSGEAVSVWEEPGQNATLIVHPAAVGTLTQSGSDWQLQSQRYGTVTLRGNNPTLLGLKQLTAGQQVMAFGSPSGQEVDTAAVAARPIMVRTTLSQVQNGSLTLQSTEYGTLTYGLDGLPSHFKNTLEALKPGSWVQAYLNPMTHEVLVAWPDHTERWAKTLEKGTAGQVIAISPKDITITNHIGTVTIPHDSHVSVQWPGHDKATVEQIPVGSRIIAVRNQQGQLQILVLTGKTS